MGTIETAMSWSKLMELRVNVLRNSSSNMILSFSVDTWSCSDACETPSNLKRFLYHPDGMYKGPRKIFIKI